jgi:hypothetical protein
VVCTPHQNLGDRVKEDGMGGACGTYGGKKKFTQDFGGAT